MAIQEVTDTEAGDDQMALVDATIPYDDKMAKLQLELDGVMIASYTNKTTTPPAVKGLKVNRAPNSKTATVSWNALPASVGNITYTVLGSTDNKHWTAIAVGLTQPKLTLSSGQMKLRALRVTATNGFRNSLPANIAVPNR